MSAREPFTAFLDGLLAPVDEVDHEFEECTERGAGSLDVPAERATCRRCLDADVHTGSGVEQGADLGKSAFVLVRDISRALAKFFTAVSHGASSHAGDPK